MPDDLPIIVIANEFFDALPVRQVSAEAEVHVAAAGTGFARLELAAPVFGPKEWSDAAETLAAAIGNRLRQSGGAALIIDYGYAGEGAADTVQAVRGHARADPFADPGSSDLTAHVNFSALAAAAGDVRVSGPVPQGVWLARLGIEARAAALKVGATPAQAAAIEAALVRLTAPAQMGTLFKAMALTATGWSAPAGFDS